MPIAAVSQSLPEVERVTQVVCRRVARAQWRQAPPMFDEREIELVS